MNSLLLSQFAGESPLHIAANNNHAELSELLLVSGAAINVKDKVRACILYLYYTVVL